MCKRTLGIVNLFSTQRTAQSTVTGKENHIAPCIVLPTLPYLYPYEFTVQVECTPHQ